MNTVRKVTYSFALFTAVFFLNACERVIDLNLRNDVGKLVIEANITDRLQVQTIRLTENVSFSADNDYPSVRGAVVSVRSSAGDQYEFKETGPGIYTSEPFSGVAGQKYYMTVEAEGKTYKATSEMPLLIHLDSIVSAKKEISDEYDERRIAVKFKDPAGSPDQYRFLLHLNDTLVKQIFTTDDRLTNGRNITYYFNINDDDLKIRVGDSVTVEMQCVDKAVYTYWNTLAQQDGSGGPGGGVSPANPPTNISPAVLGYFSAHTIEVQSIIVH